MAVPKKIVNFLEKSKVKYEILKHRTVYTAFDKAQTLKVPEKTIGKTLLLKLAQKLAIVLIGADKNLDIQKFKKLAKEKKVEFASEKLIKNKIKARLPSPGAKVTGGQGIKVGAVPPFGNLWGLLTFIDGSLIKEKEIILNGGDYNFSIKISSVSFKKLIPELVIGNFGKAKK